MRLVLHWYSHAVCGQRFYPMYRHVYPQSSNENLKRRKQMNIAASAGILPLPPIASRAGS
jgi:hypothetical protein